MAISIDWGGRVINVPKADLTLVSGSVYELDVDVFRLALKDLEDGEAGMVFPRTHNHNTEVTVGGVTLARVVEILSPYTVTFEDGQYAVNLVGANSNISDVTNVNQVSIRPQNSAGMIVSGSGVTAQDKTDIANQTRVEVFENVDLDSLSLAELMRLMASVWAGDIVRNGDAYSLRSRADATRERIAATVDADGNRTITAVDVGP